MILRFVVLMLFKARALSWFPFGIVNLQNHPVFSFGIFIRYFHSNLCIRSKKGECAS